MNKYWPYIIVLFIVVVFIGSSFFHKEIVTDHQIMRKIISRYSNKHPKEVVYDITYAEKTSDLKEKFAAPPVKKETVKILYNPKDRVLRSEGEIPALIVPYEMRYEKYPMGDLTWEQNIKQQLTYEFSFASGFKEKSSESILNGTVKGNYQDGSLAWECKWDNELLIASEPINEICKTYYDNGQVKYSDALKGEYLVDRKAYDRKGLQKFHYTYSVSEKKSAGIFEETKKVRKKKVKPPPSE
ncbi:MAG TPA: hypothetical protein VMT12_17130 [Syntrophales bacterium]|nr:hypothetical protein [Syntrophales bacterium]